MTTRKGEGNTDIIRLIAAVLLLAPAIFYSWRTVSELSTRRLLRTELAEIGHVRYGVLNADRWVEQLVPILNKQIEAIDLTASNRASLRPMVEKSLYRLLDQVKQQMAPKSPPGGASGGFAAQATAMMAGVMIDNLRPKVPEFSTVVLKELTTPENKQALRNYLKGMLEDGAKNTFSPVDMTWYSAILRQNNCADAAACRAVLGSRIAKADGNVAQSSVLALCSAALAFALLLIGRRTLRWYDVLVLLLFCVALLLGGIFSPMIEVEAQISRLTFTLLGQPVAFPGQVLYFQSKSVLEVFRTLIELSQPEMWIVGMLVLMFSVVFPAIKLLTLGACLGRPGWIGRYRIVRFFALESSKWSMADVMALAIFMSFVAFNGVISSAMGGLHAPGVELVIPTESSKMLPGFYLFIGFVLASLVLSWRLERSLKAELADQTAT